MKTSLFYTKFSIILKRNRVEIISFKLKRKIKREKKVIESKPSVSCENYAVNEMEICQTRMRRNSFACFTYKHGCLLAFYSQCVNPTQSKAKRCANSTKWFSVLYIQFSHIKKLVETNENCITKKILRKKYLFSITAINVFQYSAFELRLRFVWRSLISMSTKFRVQLKRL